ncbi:hypothetical protein BaRGS_00034113 [Batillaria attramentaria]|uniref:Uncharacterized protein n=1 Tax=Batillaria attramentaria TaxID=370345 RepID=A0ABD0JI58_9CAEN
MSSTQSRKYLNCLDLGSSCTYLLSQIVVPNAAELRCKSTGVVSLPSLSHGPHLVTTRPDTEQYGGLRGSDAEECKVVFRLQTLVSYIYLSAAQTCSTNMHWSFLPL